MSLPLWDTEIIILKTKESLLIKRDIPILNKNIRSAKLLIFNNS